MRVPAAVALLLLALLPPSARAADSEPIPLPDGQPWRHEPSGFVFPPDVGTFTRAGASRYDEHGRNVSVAYTDAALRVLVTAYVYPNAGHPLAGHFEQVKRDVLEVHPEARLLGQGVWKLEQGDRTLTGRRAAFTFRVSANGREHDVVSEAYLLREGEHFIKFRVTCPKPRFEAAADRVGRFLRALKVPQVAPAAAGK